MSITATRNVSASDRGMEYSTPSSPKKNGSSSANPTPKTISRIMERIVEAAALPMACKKMKHALFTQAKTIMHWYGRAAAGYAYLSAHTILQTAKKLL